MFNSKDETSRSALKLLKVARNCSKSLEKCLENPLLSSSRVTFLPCVRYMALFTRFAEVKGRFLGNQTSISGPDLEGMEPILQIKT